MLLKESTSLSFILFLLSICCQQGIVEGQAWKWIGGTSSLYDSGVYGALGVENSTFIPSARWQTASWRQELENGTIFLWLFGGQFYAPTSTTDLFGYNNEMWRYDTSNRKWSWVGGSRDSNQPAIYGNKGGSPPSNPPAYPSARSEAVSWQIGGSTPNFWLFGGMGVASNGRGRLNDLWHFDGTKWSWMTGSTVTENQSVYGTIGVPSELNTPGARTKATGWVDSEGALWLFGGFGVSGNQIGHFNQLWKYHNGNWTFVSGSTQVNQAGSYGVQGVSSNSTFPPGLSSAASWMDSKGRAWVFGGEINNAIQGDLWSWDGEHWTWVWGLGLNNVQRFILQQGTPSEFNTPGSRRMSGYWLGSGDTLWLSCGGRHGFFNDIWTFNTTSMMWTYISGTVVTDDFGGSGLYQDKNEFSLNAFPGSRLKPTIWKGDEDGHTLWLFGGNGFAIGTARTGFLNDMWFMDTNYNQSTLVYTSGPTTMSFGTGNVIENDVSENSLPGFFDRVENIISVAVVGLVIFSLIISLVIKIRIWVFRWNFVRNREKQDPTIRKRTKAQVLYLICFPPKRPPEDERQQEESYGSYYYEEDVESQIISKAPSKSPSKTLSDKEVAKSRSKQEVTKNKSEQLTKEKKSETLEALVGPDDAQDVDSHESVDVSAEEKESANGNEEAHTGDKL